MLLSSLRGTLEEGDHIFSKACCENLNRPESIGLIDSMHSEAKAKVVMQCG